MHDLGPTAQQMARVVARVGDDDLARPTPCGEWTVRDLLGHLLAFAGHFVRVARHEETQAGGAPEQLPDDWRTELDARLDDLVTAWREPSAWEGEGQAGGLSMPRADLGVVALEELVLHGWDLAQAIGTAYEVRDEDLAIVRGFVATFEHAPQEQRTGLYGPVVSTDSGSELERVLALAGRDPRRPLTTAG
ncbi:TIGR03086 family metal-binding protein [Actinomycetospora straminea]|uniref:TIGR03086 family metal-binding protein n=1 Tax=Actinomycetospora straminea TaxID=663607 RepID=A0ABP9ELC0_9PSEU|nr:TIGR03086 family metal-binding protein [Actinomycetospora straminea]MDD7933103.1 TIGR03086 family metal-binding protein [Actinomycetospora straminea]